jgi:endoglucanase
MRILRIPLAGLLSLAVFTHAPADPVIHRGINFGNALEAPHEGGMGVVIQPDYFPTIHNAGFDTVRVPILWIAHVGPAPAYTIDPAFFKRIDWVVALSRQNNLNAILDYHYDPELMENPDAYADRYVAIWKQIAEHYQAEPASILFELMNEPHDKLDSAHWNPLILRALAVIRPTNPTRTVVVGPVKWNSFDKLPELNLPENDHHLLATFHYYLPMPFTHQGAGWIQGSQAWMGTKWEGTDAQKAVIAHDFGAAVDWARAHQRPLYLGEFGADSRGEMASRARWIACSARTAEGLGIRWSYWEFCAIDFGAYDPIAHQWRKPILDALIPPSAR